MSNLALLTREMTIGDPATTPTIASSDGTCHWLNLPKELRDRIFRDVYGRPDEPLNLKFKGDFKRVQNIEKCECEEDERLFVVRQSQGEDTMAMRAIETHARFREYLHPRLPRLTSRAASSLQALYYPFLREPLLRFRSRRGFLRNHRAPPHQHAQPQHLRPQPLQRHANARLRIPLLCSHRLQRPAQASASLRQHLPSPAAPSRHLHFRAAKTLPLRQLSSHRVRDSEAADIGMAGRNRLSERTPHCCA